MELIYTAKTKNVYYVQ